MLSSIGGKILTFAGACKPIGGGGLGKYSHARNYSIDW